MHEAKTHGAKTQAPTPPAAPIPRREFLKRGAAGLAGAALYGAPAVRRAPVEITFAFGPDDSGTLRRLIDGFNAAHEGDVRVTWREMARASDAYYRQLASDFQAGAADIDVLGADVVWTAPFAHHGWVLDLSRRFFGAYDPDDFLSAALDSAVYRFRVWGMPWYTDAGMLFYRRDLLAQSGFTAPPTTWSDLSRMARRVMQEAGVPHGFVFQGAEYEGGVANAVEYLWSAGGRVLTGNLSVAGAFGQRLIDPNVITVNSEDSARGFDVARRFVAEGVAPGAVVTYQELESLRVFLAGEAVFMRNWPYIYGVLRDPSQSGLRPEQVGVAPIPVASSGIKSASCLGGWNLMINARAPRARRNAAWTFIQYAVGEQRQRARALQGGFLPTLRSLYDDPQILSAVPVIALGKEAITNTRVRPVSPFYMQMAPRIARAFNRVLRGELTGAEAASTLQDELQTILARNR